MGYKINKIEHLNTLNSLGAQLPSNDIKDINTNDTEQEEYTISWTIKLKTKIKANSFNELYHHLDKIDVQRGGKYVIGSMKNLEIEGLPYSKN